MAILDHFGYPTFPFVDLDDPLWYIREQFNPWLKLHKNKRHLILMKDPASSDFIISQKTQTDDPYTGLEVEPISFPLANPTNTADEKIEPKKEKKS